MPKKEQSDPDQEPPKKPVRKTRKKVEPKKKPTQPPRGYSTDGMEKGLSALFFGYEDPLAKKRKGNKQAMCNNIDEFLSAYIVLGYDMDGEPVVATQANSQKDFDALSVALQKYIFSIAKPPFPPGDFMD